MLQISFFFLPSIKMLPKTSFQILLTSLHNIKSTALWWFFFYKKMNVNLMEGMKKDEVKCEMIWKEFHFSRENWDFLLLTFFLLQLKCNAHFSTNFLPCWKKFWAFFAKFLRWNRQKRCKKREFSHFPFFKQVKSHFCSRY